MGNEDNIEQKVFCKAKMFGEFPSKTWACATFSFSLEGAKCRRVFPALISRTRNYEQKKVALWTAKKGGEGR